MTKKLLATTAAASAVVGLLITAPATSPAAPSPAAPTDPAIAGTMWVGHEEGSGHGKFAVTVTFSKKDSTHVTAKYWDCLTGDQDVVTAEKKNDKSENTWYFTNASTKKTLTFDYTTKPWKLTTVGVSIADGKPQTKGSLTRVLDETELTKYQSDKPQPACPPQ